MADRAADPPLVHRLRRLGLRGVSRIETHRNRTVIVSFSPRRVLRLHEGFAAASDRVLKAIARFVAPGTSRALRDAARFEIVSFPVEQFAPPPPRALVPPAEDGPMLQELQRLHGQLNARHFDGSLGDVSFRLSRRMRRRLGQFTQPPGSEPAEIAINRRHLWRDGWTAVQRTLLHEMVHQWQAETGERVDHGPLFRAKGREIGLIDS